MKYYTTEYEAISKAQSDYDCFVDEFDSKNCNDIPDNYCSGWDTESRRCNCGNRRVYWATNKTDDGTYYAYATAW